MSNSTNRIKRIFDELRDQGKLPPERPKRATKSKPPQVTDRCCLGIFADKLPAHFVHCIDCPRLDK